MDRGPSVGARVARWLLGLRGWRVDVAPFPGPKGIVVVYPHTSNWDFPIGYLAKTAAGLDAHFAGKDTLFRWPLGSLFRWLGGIPVNRRERSNAVAQMIDEFAGRERFVLGITPEGTRRRTGGWKTGFYRIATGAEVPLLIGVIDYGRKEAGILAHLDLVGDRDADLARIASCYAGRRGRHPELASPIRWLD